MSSIVEKELQHMETLQSMQAAKTFLLKKNVKDEGSCFKWIQT